MGKTMKKKQQLAIPNIRRVIMEKDGNRYLAMPVSSRVLYPGKWKCGKCLRGVIIPMLYLWDVPYCKVCHAFVRDIEYTDTYLANRFTDLKVFRYSYEHRNEV